MTGNNNRTRGGLQSFTPRWAGCAAALLLAAGSLSTPQGMAGGPDATPGYRQAMRHGKYWPPYPRPAGRKASFTDQFHYAHYWPYPHTCEDQGGMQAMIEQQVAAGWIAETTFYDYHFDPATGELTGAGLRHLEWILFSTPPRHRAAYVALGKTAEISEARYAAVEAAALDMLQGDPLPPIEFRRARALGTNSEEVDLIRRKWLQSAPNPRLPYAPLGSNAGGGSSGSGGGASSGGM